VSNTGMGSKNTPPDSSFGGGGSSAFATFLRFRIFFANLCACKRQHVASSQQLHRSPYPSAASQAESTHVDAYTHCHTCTFTLCLKHMPLAHTQCHKVSHAVSHTHCQSQTLTYSVNTHTHTHIHTRTERETVQDSEITQRHTQQLLGSHTVSVTQKTRIDTPVS
jgi:hypothetical protein